MSASDAPVASRGGAPDFAGLARRIAAGEPVAETELIRQLSRGVLILLRRWSRDPTLAEDLLQETWATVLARLRQGALRDPAALPGFVRGTARNTFLAYRRKGQRYRPLGDDEDHAEHTLRGGETAHRDEPQLRAVLASEAAESVRRLLGEMRNARDREILVRVYLRADSKQDICRDLDVDPALYNRVLYRARQRFRELVERDRKREQLRPAGR